MVRQGAERAEVAASFAALPEAARAWLEAQSIEHDGELVVRRVIGADGRSRAYVNGQVVPMQALRELAEFLIEIHGQQEFQHLVNRGAQRELLDEHLADSELLAAVAALYERYRNCRRDFESLQGRGGKSRFAARPAALPARRARRPRSPRRPPSRSCSSTKSASPAAAAWARRRKPR